VLAQVHGHRPRARENAGRYLLAPGRSVSVGGPQVGSPAEWACARCRAAWLPWQDGCLAVASPAGVKPIVCAAGYLGLACRCHD
jgi:hypothetical protein